MNRLKICLIFYVLLALLFQKPANADDETSGRATSVESRVADSELIVIGVPVASKFVKREGHARECVSVTYQVLESLKGKPQRSVTVASVPMSSMYLSFAEEDESLLKRHKATDKYLLFLSSSNQLDKKTAKTFGVDPSSVAPWVLASDCGNGDVWSSEIRFKNLNDPYDTGRTANGVTLANGLTLDPFNTRLRRTNTYSDLLELVREAVAWEQAHGGATTQSVVIRIDWKDVVGEGTKTLRPDIYEGAVRFPLDARTEAMVQPWLSRGMPTKLEALQVLANFPCAENAKRILPLLDDQDINEDNLESCNKWEGLPYPVRVAAVKVLDDWRVMHKTCALALPLDRVATWAEISAWGGGVVLTLVGFLYGWRRWGWNGAAGVLGAILMLTLALLHSHAGSQIEELAVSSPGFRVEMSVYGNRVRFLHTPTAKHWGVTRISLPLPKAPWEHGISSLALRPVYTEATNWEKVGYFARGKSVPFEMVILPYYVLYAVPGVLVGSYIARRMRAFYRRRKQQCKGLCLGCGYDLRAHKQGEKCPECGRVAGAGTPSTPLLN